MGENLRPKALLFIEIQLDNLSSVIFENTALK